MMNRKYLKTTEVTELTKRPYYEILSLVNTGVLPGYKTRRGRWLLKVGAVEEYFGIQINNPAEMDDKLDTTSETRLIINDSHYQEIIERICVAKSSIKIMTGDFKRFNLKPTKKQGKDYKDGKPFIKHLMEKAVDGVSVQIICSKPSPFFMDEWMEYYRQMKNPKLFEFKFCIRNHSKVVIIDDKLVYVGSANVTPAGLGQGIFTPGNFEAGILTENQDLVSSVIALFSEIWSSKSCINCHRADKCQE